MESRDRRKVSRDEFWFDMNSFGGKRHLLTNKVWQNWPSFEKKEGGTWLQANKIGKICSCDYMTKE